MAMPYGHSGKMKSHNTLTTFFALALAVMILFLPMPADSGDDFSAAAKSALKKLAEDGSLLSSCIQYEGLTPKGGCTSANLAGEGLNCPTTNYAYGGKTENCEKSIMEQVKLNLNAAGLAKLEASKLSTAMMNVTIYPISSVSHSHQDCGTEGEAECAEEFLKRKDYVSYKLAIWNASSVTVGMLNSNFDIQVLESEGFSDSFSVLICGWKKHDEPRTCSNPEPCQGETPPAEPDSTRE